MATAGTRGERPYRRCRRPRRSPRPPAAPRRATRPRRAWHRSQAPLEPVAPTGPGAPHRPSTPQRYGFRATLSNDWPETVAQIDWKGKKRCTAATKFQNPQALRIRQTRLLLSGQRRPPDPSRRRGPNSCEGDATSCRPRRSKLVHPRSISAGGWRLIRDWLVRRPDQGPSRAPHRLRRSSRDARWRR